MAEDEAANGLSDAEERQRRHDFYFPATVPDVAIAGLDVKKIMLRNIDGIGGEKTEIEWRVACVIVRAEPGPDAIVVGDLQARQEDYFAGCQAWAHIDFRDRSLIPADDDEVMTKDLAAWASPSLYDFAAAQIRMMVSAAAGCDIKVPVVTPLADLEGLKITAELES